MKVSKLLTVLAALLPLGHGVRAANNDSTQVNWWQLDKRVAQLETKSRQQQVWKRKKYLNVGYVRQTLKDQTAGLKYESDYGLALVKGTTYYLHAEPLGGVVKIGLDWTQADLNVVKYQDLHLATLTGEPKIGTYQLEYGMHVGPSVTVNPIDYLKVSFYAHYAPSMSFIIDDADGEAHGHYNYVTFFVLGGAIAHKALSLGFETRFGNGKYNSFKRSDDNYEFNGGMPSVDEFLIRSKSKMKTSATRLYLSLRF